MDDKVLPWLTKDYIKIALDDGKNESNILSIESMDLDMAAAKGNNYACAVYRVKVYYKIKDKNDIQKISLIIKVPNETGFLQKMGIYEKEVLMYNELLPKYKSIFGDKWKNLTAKSYYSIKENIIILEDLKEKGYIMADRIKQLNFEECEIALKSLAKFHAASVKLYETEPELIKKVGKECLFQEDVKESIIGFNNSGFKCLIDECKKKSSLIKYVDSLKIFGENLWNIGIKKIKPKKSDFNVLNHGDYWTANMMFKYIDNKPIDVKPLDLQVCRYSSPAYDIIYFMYLAAKEEIRIKQSDQLLIIYLKELNYNLELFGSEIRLNKTELMKAIEERLFFAVYATIILLPLVLADLKEDEILEINELSEEDINNMEKHNALSQYYNNNDNYFKILPKRLEVFHEKGWFM